MTYNPHIKKEDDPYLIYYVDKWGMMLQRSFPWEQTKDDGKGDALWRTAFSYLIYHKEENSEMLLNGIKSCFIKKAHQEYPDGYYYQVYRHPDNIGKFQSTVSRDQVNAAFVALKLTGQQELLDEYIKHMPIQLSKRFSQTIDFWLWTESLGDVNYGYKDIAYSQWYATISIIIALFVQGWNKLLRRIAKIKKFSQEDFQSIPSHELPFLKRVASKMMFPTYAFFLWVWQVYSIPNGQLKSALQNILLMECEESNYVLRILLGDKNISSNELAAYRSMIGVRWNNRLDETANDGMRKMSDAEKKYNDIDGDMLKYVASFL